MTRRVPRPFLVLAAASAVALGACSSAGATPPIPTINPSAVAATAKPTAVPSVAATPAAPSAAASAGASAGGSAGSGSVDLSKCPTSQPAPLKAGETRTVTITTAKGPIVIKVDAKNGPIATGNFVALAECGYYDNVVFHRLVPGFVIQGGDGQYGRAPNVNMDRVGDGGPGYTIKDEPVVGDYVRGVVAMARTQQPNSQGSQFFITLADLTQQLDKAGDYVILGTVTSGMDVVDAIAAEPNAGPPGNTAVNPEPMTKVTVSNP